MNGILPTDPYLEGILTGLVSGILLVAMRYTILGAIGLTKSHPLKGYVGKYWFYVPKSACGDDWVYRKVKIIRRFGSIKVKPWGKEDIKYHGELVFYNHNFYSYFRGEFGNHWNSVFHRPVLERINTIVGATSGVSATNEPYTGVCILSKVELEKSALNSIAGDSIAYSNHHYKSIKKTRKLLDEIVGINPEASDKTESEPNDGDNVD